MLNKEQIVGVPGAFVLIAAFKLRAEWSYAGATVYTRAAEEVLQVLTRSAHKVVVDVYLSQGLEPTSDYFLRVHAFDLAEAQSYLADFGGTVIGKHSQVTEIMIGLIKPRQYITRERSAQLDRELNASRYEGDDPRFAIVIPVKKSARWWSLAQSERLYEIEDHTQKSLAYLPRVKRMLYHSTGLDEMDFITYFETADLQAFHELSVTLAGIRENEFHTRWGQPILLGTIQSAPETVRILCRRAESTSPPLIESDPTRA